MKRLGFVYDQTRCIGCSTCQMACTDNHDLEPGFFFRRVETVESKQDGRIFVQHFSGACNHCSDPACTKACPTGAMRKNADGTVGHDRSLCQGCGCCAFACPYGAPKLSHRYGFAMKCDSCASRREEGKEPFCVEACLTHCLKFGDIDELTKDSSYTYVSDLSILPSKEITDPSLKIRRKLP